MTKLEVEIGADIKDLQSKVNSATKDLKDFGNDSKKNLGNFSKSANTANKSISNMSKGVANGSSAMTAFSRTVQDAPFGLMGVSNNITNLTEQFGYLKKRTGSAGGALKAMLSDLKGFGGITLAISLVTSALLVFGDKINFGTAKTKEFTDALEGVSSRGIVEFKALTDTILDTNASQKEQSKAIEILKDKYSDFDTSLLTTKGNYEAGKIAIDNYIGSLVQQAKAQAALTLIQEKQSKILALEEEKALKIKERFGVNSIQEAQKIVDNENKLAEKGYDVRQKRTANNANFALNNLKEYNKDEISEIESQISTLTSLANVRDLILFGKKNKPKTLERKPVFVDFKLDDSSFDILETVDLSENDWIGDSPFNWDEYFKLKDLDTKAMELQSKFTQLSEGINNILQNNFASALSNVGTAIGNALATGQNVASAIGQSLIGAFGGFLSEMGDYLIKYGLLAKAKGTLDTAIAAGGPLAIAAGAAAVGVGIALKAAGAALSSKAQSGFGGSNATAGGGASSNNSFSSGFSGGYANNQRVEFVIRGESLYGVLDNYMSRNRNLGGSLQTL
jgi:hypothetical protein